MQSNRASPAGHALHLCTLDSGEYPNRCRPTNCDWIDRSHSATGTSGSILILTGRVLTNSPTMDSTPDNSSGRPDMTVPKTTSFDPQYRPYNSAQAAWTAVFSVTLFVRI